MSVLVDNKLENDDKIIRREKNCVCKEKRKKEKKEEEIALGIVVVSALKCLSFLS